MRRCPYCGYETLQPLACDDCVDLVPLDLDWNLDRSEERLYQSDVDGPEATGWIRYELRQWWLTRYPLADLLTLADELELVAAAL